MAERIARPPIRLGAGLPDGQLLGATDKDVQGFLVENPDGQVIDRYAVIRVIRRETRHSDETGAEVALLRVAAIEFLPGDVMPATEQRPAGEFMAELRTNRLGENVLDFAGAAAAESVAQLRDKVQLWANESEVPPEELADEIRKVVPNIPDGVDVLRDAAVLTEFLTIIREREDDAFDRETAEREAAAKVDGTPRGRRNGKAAKLAPVPEAGFSEPAQPDEPSAEPAAQ